MDSGMFVSLAVVGACGWQSAEAAAARASLEEKDRELVSDVVICPRFHPSPLLHPHPTPRLPPPRLPPYRLGGGGEFEPK